MSSNSLTNLGTDAHREKPNLSLTIELIDEYLQLQFSKYEQDEYIDIESADVLSTLHLGVYSIIENNGQLSSSISDCLVKEFILAKLNVYRGMSSTLDKVTLAQNPISNIEGYNIYCDAIYVLYNFAMSGRGSGSFAVAGFLMSLQNQSVSFHLSKLSNLSDHYYDLILSVLKYRKIFRITPKNSMQNGDDAFSLLQKRWFSATLE